MIDEQKLIPYTTSTLPPSPWLILSPHPDDETIGMGGTIAIGAKKGFNIQVVMVTDGSIGGDPDLRRQEAELAAKILGIEKIIWWGIKDRETHLHKEVFCNNLPQLIKKFAPKTIFLPSPFEFHPDHRFTTKWAIECLKKINYQGEIWLYEISRQGEVNRLIDITPLASLKQKAIKIYHSQINQRPYDEVALALNRARSYTLENAKYAEGFWKISQFSLTEIESRIKKYLEDEKFLFSIQKDYNPLVSIIIRTKDRPELLKEALQSLADQTYKKIEAIVVNDGGEDVSSIVNSFKSTIYKIKYIHHPKNIGRAAAANSGLYKAEGKWIGLLDDDDILLPLAISNLISSARVSGAVYGRVEAIHYHLSKNKTDLFHIFGQPFSREALFLANYIPTCGFLFKKRLALKIKGFDTDFERLEDWDFIYRLSKETEFVFVPETVAIYRLFNRGHALESNYQTEAPYREKFYQKHLPTATPKTISKGLFDTLEVQVQGRESAIAKEKDAHIANLQDIIKQKDIHIENLQVIIQQKDSLLQNQSKQLEKLKTSLKKEVEIRKQKENRIIDLMNDLEQEIEIRKQKEQMIIEMMNTISWKITEPLRRLRLFLRKIKHRDKKLELPYNPLISIIVPVYNPPKKFLQRCLQSVFNQSYTNWELCIVDDASTNPEIKDILKQIEAQNNRRIKVVYREENGHICRASNSGLEIATGEFIALLDHDDELDKDALLEVVKLLSHHPDADFIYTDEDKIDEKGRRKDPYYKPDWSPEFFLGQMYTCHLSVFRKSIVDKIGGFRQGFEGAQDYDLTLRFTEQSDKIYHIPKVLYHWRQHSLSTAKDQSSKEYAFKAGLRAVEDALKRRKQGAWAEEIIKGRHLIHYPFKNNVLISIIIPSKDLSDTLNRCLNSIFTKSSYKDFEVIIVDNNSIEDSTFKMYEKWKEQEKDRFRVEKYDIPFNFSKLVNYGVEKAKGDVVLLLNNDIELITPDNWLEEMGGYAIQKEIGCVGAVLLYPDNTIQHAGVILGIRGSKRIPGVAGHAFKYLPGNHPGYFDRMRVVSNYSAVTGACLMIEKKKWKEVGGFDEELAVAFNDVDFCIKIMQKGYRNVVLPHVRLYHYESKSRGYEDTKEKQRRFKREIKIMRDRWAKILDNDPHYNPNLPIDREDFGLQ